MSLVELDRRERRLLQHLLKHTSDATTLRRVLAILWLDYGERVVDVAQRLGVSRQVIYQWVEIFLSDDSSDLATRLATGQRSGRPCTVKGIIDPFIDEAIAHNPFTFGYNSTVWTAPLLAQYLTDQHGLTASVPSVRLALQRLKVSWKRPRYELSLRSPTWRQAKGGLKRGYLAVSER